MHTGSGIARLCQAVMHAQPRANALHVEQQFCVLYSPSITLSLSASATLSFKHAITLIVVWLILNAP
jgi:hypothetical protein